MKETVYYTRKDAMKTSFLFRPIAVALLCFIPILAFSVAGAPAVSSRTAKPSQEADPMNRQISELLTALRGLRVGLITNPTGVDNQLTPIADILHADPATTLSCFFAPEHGLRGDQQAGGSVTDYVDPVTGIPVYSIYGAPNAPTDDQLRNVDVLVFDIQDVGARFYTYVWTMTHCMEAAARNGKKFIVFDRPNPIGGIKVEGAPNTSDYGLIGRLLPGKPFGVPVRHGLTAGEFAMLINGEWLDSKVDLKVIRMHDWTRDQYFEQTGRPWVLPSPNMPTIEAAVVYTGTCIFEGANVSEGRGTTKPFEVIGAPWINGVDLAAHLNAVGLPGVRFRAAYFKPTFDDHAGVFCGGVQVHVMDREAFEAVRTGLVMLKTICEMYPEEIKVREWVSKLMGIPDLHTRILAESVDTLIEEYQANLNAYMKIREKYLIYPVASR